HSQTRQLAFREAARRIAPRQSEVNSTIGNGLSIRPLHRRVPRQSSNREPRHSPFTAAVLEWPDAMNQIFAVDQVKPHDRDIAFYTALAIRLHGSARGPTTQPGDMQSGER